ncbi:MAG: hypothetical protein ACO1G9_07430 [Bacteroidota bacterium]
MKKILSFIFGSLLFLSAQAQYSIRDSSISFPMIGATFSYEFPAADMADRFGPNFSIGAVFQWKLKSNWLLGAEGNFMFSDEVKENNILDNYKTPDGYIIDGAGQYAIVTLTERGMRFNLKAGKIFPLFGPNKNSGLLTSVGLGYLQHRIYIDTPGSPIPWLEDDKRRGFDRMSSGLFLNQFVGYINFSNKRLVNFFAGFEFTEGFTKNQREYNFDTGLKDDKNRTDILIGFKAGWVFPLYKRVADKFYID